jgi:hypothetical protein
MQWMEQRIMHDLTRMALIYPHLIACCVAIGAAFLADWRLIRSRGQVLEHDAALIREVARLVIIALTMLWLTGLGITLIDFGHWPSLAELAAKPKMATKLLVVVGLTANGVLLHHIALPRLTAAPAPSAQPAVVCGIGGFSAVSWAFAAFLGIARPLASRLNLAGFLSLYGTVACLGVAGGLLFAYWSGRTTAAPQAA